MCMGFMWNNNPLHLHREGTRGILKNLFISTRKSPLLRYTGQLFRWTVFCEFRWPQETDTFLGTSADIMYCSRRHVWRSVCFKGLNPNFQLFTVFLPCGATLSVSAIWYCLESPVVCNCWVMSRDITRTCKTCNNMYFGVWCTEMFLEV
jgi:hypothetical protein